MSRIHVFTSAAVNYLPKARALFASLRRRHPDWRLHLALPDLADREKARAATGADEVHLLGDLDIPALPAWTFSHSLVELATAIKPFVLRKILAGGEADGVIYLDPDIVVFSPLTEVVEALGQASILLTPHQTRPEATVGGVIADEICTLQHGVYNLGFIAVSATGEGPAFADWWAQRCYHFCHEDVASGLYTDQAWIDLAPAFFDGVKILRAPALNVGPWNLSQRRLTGDAPDALLVDGAPLGFFHFSAVENGGFGRFQDQPSVAGLMRWYAEETTAGAGSGGAPWAFGAFADGTPISAEQRLVFRLRGDLQRAFPDPFASGPGTFQDWWRTQARAEFPDLFDPARRAGELARLTSALTTGYADLTP